MKKIMLFLCCLFVTLGLCGCQNNVIDSGTKLNRVEGFPNGGVIEGGRLKYFDADPEKTPLIHEAILLNYSRDYKESHDKMLEALEKGEFDPIAYYFLANYYYYGRGVEEDKDISMEYNAIGREYQQPVCIYNLGVAYETKGDLDKAFALYDEAIELGEPGGYTRYIDRELRNDQALAESYTDKVIESNDPFAINHAGEVHLAHNKGSKRSFELFSLVADIGYANGMVNVANAYDKGYGIDKDPQKAYEYYMKAAETFEYADYYIHVGYCYEYGVGVEKDIDKAIEYYKLSTKDGNGDGYYKIGYLYETGKTVDKDYEKALEYYELGCNAKIPSKDALRRYNYLLNYTKK